MTRIRPWRFRMSRKTVRLRVTWQEDILMLRSLSLGARGQDVLAVQRALNLKREPQDAALAEGGVFSPRTNAAVRTFQHRHSLPATGIVGPLTRAAFPEAAATVRAIGMSSAIIS